MRLLLDTHTFLWFFVGDSSLSATARSLIEDEFNERYLSVASLWEIAIKVSIGKLTLSAPFDEIFPHHLTNNAIDLLGITLSHTSVITTLPFHHRDPFDRLLIAQAMTDQMEIVSGDGAFDDYSVTRLW